MEWLVVAAIGLVIGTLFSFIAQGVNMPQSLSLVLALVGALAGASLERITNIALFGRWTFYLSGALVAVGFLVGGMLAYTLTSRERRV